MMSAADVVELMQLFDRSHCSVWVDGGWGVDALLGQQTRHHADLDLALALADVALVQDLLVGELGYVVAEDEMPTRLELRDSQDHRIDLHPLVFDSEGNGGQQLQGGSWGMYLADGLAGSGVIQGQYVRCLSPQLQLRFHLGYEPDDDDRHDVALLCHHFGFEVPDGYRTPRGWCQAGKKKPDADQANRGR
jgi:lincosamide nucleotidyltransferase A/C/D/E